MNSSEYDMDTPMIEQSYQKTASSENTKKDTTVSIGELIDKTPSLESYVVGNILTREGSPEGYEGKYKFTLYKGWDGGGCQRGRVCLYHKVYDKKKEMYTTAITSYFIEVRSNAIGIHLPASKGTKPDIHIDFPK